MGDKLSPKHRQMLESESGISTEMVRTRGYLTLTNKMELASLGFTSVQRRVPGLLLPLHGTDGSQPTFQYRPDSPRANRDGRPVKYETPKGAGIRVDCPPVVHHQLADPLDTNHFDLTIRDPMAVRNLSRIKPVGSVK